MHHGCRERRHFYRLHSADKKSTTSLPPAVHTVQARVMSLIRVGMWKFCKVATDKKFGLSDKLPKDNGVFFLFWYNNIAQTPVREITRFVLLSTIH